MSTSIAFGAILETGDKLREARHQRQLIEAQLTCDPWGCAKDLGLGGRTPNADQQRAWVVQHPKRIAAKAIEDKALADINEACFRAIDNCPNQIEAVIDLRKQLTSWA